MEKNISSFVYKHYIFYNTKNFILRVLGLFLVSYLAIICVEISSPHGFDSVSFFSEISFPFTVGLTLSAILVSLISFLLYRIKKLWSCISMRGITNIYISALLLIVSFFEFDGNTLFAENYFLIITKISLYLLIIPIDLFVLIKWIVPKCSYKSNNRFSSFKYIFGILGVVMFRLILMNNRGNVDIQELLRTIEYMLAIVLLINSIYYFMQAFFAKKYSLGILTDYTESYINSLHRL